MVLEYLAATGSAYSVKSLADEFKMPNSHVCRLLKSLVQTGYVEQAFIKDQDVAVNKLIENVGKDIGDNIEIRRFERYEVGGSR